MSLKTEQKANGNASEKKNDLEIIKGKVSLVCLASDVLSPKPHFFYVAGDLAVDDVIPILPIHFEIPVPSREDINRSAIQFFKNKLSKHNSFSEEEKNKIETQIRALEEIDEQQNIQKHGGNDCS